MDGTGTLQKTKDIVLKALGDQDVQIYLFGSWARHEQKKVRISILPLRGKWIFQRLCATYGNNWKIQPFRFASMWSIWALPVKY